MQSNTSLFAHCKAALAAVGLLIASAPACAGLFTFEGSIDSGTLLGQNFSGSFSFADPTAGSSELVALDAFGLDVFGRSYTLADADTTPVALFDSGAFLGVDYISSAALPVVQLTAGFFDASESFFAYQSAEPGFDDGFGSIVFTPVAHPVPAPATLVLALSGLLLLVPSRWSAFGGRLGLGGSRHAYDFRAQASAHTPTAAVGLSGAVAPSA